MANNTKRIPRVWRVLYCGVVYFITAVGWYQLFGKTVFYTRDGVTTRTVAEFRSMFVVSIVDNAACSVEADSDSTIRRTVTGKLVEE